SMCRVTRMQTSSKPSACASRKGLTPSRRKPKRLSGVRPPATTRGRWRIEPLFAVMTKRTSSAGLVAYTAMTRALAPAVPLLLRRRWERGKEDPARRGERFGRASLPRPAGPLVWIHAARVGESLSVLPLIDRLIAMADWLHVLVT